MSCVMQAKSAFLCVGGECFYNLIMANYGELWRIMAKNLQNCIV